MSKKRGIADVSGSSMRDFAKYSIKDEPEEDEVTFLKIGPAGMPGSRDEVWDGKGHCKIAQIFISLDDESITSFQYQYVEDGRLKISPLHGHSKGNIFETVKFNGETEYITNLSGSYRNYRSEDTMINSLTIETNIRKYGPVGTLCPDDIIDEEFSFGFGPHNQFGGFFGTSSYRCISTIGAYIKPNSTLRST